MSKYDENMISLCMSSISVPQNCPRTYHLIAYDPDGDQVRCRYGAQQNVECATCDQPSGFQLDQVRNIQNIARTV